jgi:tetratricopeptide (TPR) repeat protein
VLEESGRAGEYRFKHALMQETLLSELSAARRVLLHGQIAEAFETLYGPDDRDHLAALANHYAESAVLNREHARNAVRYLRLAAEHSMAALGYDDAAKLFERCLGVIEQSHDAYGEDEAALWAALALCRRTVGENATGRAALERALALFAERGDAHSRARAWADFMEGNSATQYRAEHIMLDALIAALGDEDSIELCWLLALRGLTELGPEGDPDAARAEAMALRLGLVGAADRYQSILTRRRCLWLQKQGAFREAAALYVAEVEPGSGEAARTSAFQRSQALASAGDVEGWLASRSKHVGYARTYRRRVDEATGVADLAAIAWRRGEQAQAEQLLGEVDVNASALALLVVAAIALADGETATALRLLPADDHPAATVMSRALAAPLRIQVLFRAGDHKAARAALARLLAGWDRAYLTEQLGLCGFADVAVAALAEEPDARSLAVYLEGVPALRCYTGPWGGLGNPDVLRGALGLRFGDLDAAEQHFRTGLEWASRPDVRFVVDQGRCLQGLAEVAERRGDLETARTHLDAAGALFAAHGGARLYLDQVLAKKQFLRA